MNKRGLSLVITTLILIVLVLVAVAIIWVVVNNILKGGTEGIALGKFTLDAKIMSASLDNSSNNVSLTVKRNPGKGELNGIKFIFYDGTESEIITEEITLKELEQRRFNFHLINLNVDNLIRVSIVPIFKSESGKEIMGNIIDVYEVGGISECIINCTGKVCGNDGCGGTCSPGCEEGWYCQDGACFEGANPCDLTSASWSETSVVEGTTVTLNVVGTNCAGIDLNYSIYEDDLIGDDFVTSFIVTGLSTTWIAEWIDDGLGGDPEYYFIARVVGETEEIKSNDSLLAVTQGCTVTCATDPGCRSSLTNGQIISGECCGTGDCYDCETGYSWNGSACVAGCLPETCAGLDYECGTHANGTCAGTLNCGTCGLHTTCPLGTCICDSGWGDCNNDNSCDCDLSSNSCVGGSCVVSISLCTDLVLLMHFDQDVSPTPDDSGNGNDGIVTGATWTSSGKFGGAFDFDGINDYLTKSSQTNLDSVNFSFAFWINPNELSQDSIILHNDFETSPYDGWLFAMDRVYGDCGDGKICLWIPNGATGQYIDYVYDPPVGEWTHIAATFNINNNNISMYINGNLVLSESSTYVSPMTDPIKLQIGSWSSHYYNGTIDEVEIWSRPLKSTEILEVYNSGTPLSC